MASGRIGGPGGVLVVEPERAREWLEPLPVDALYGIGERQATILRGYGVHSIGLLATLPLPTVQRVLGGRAGRLAWERARGIDPRPVTPRALPASASLRHAFGRQVLEGAPVRAALLDVVVRLGTLLRGRGQAAQGMTLALDFAEGTSWSRTRRLPFASAHDEDLRAAAYRLMDAAALQRARLVGLSLRAEDLLDAGRVAEQGSLDGAREARLAAEEVVDRARSRFGPEVMIGKAS
ncbi:hypothetical protein [Streptomyces sp. NPDC020951]|uniref:DNA polymerase Y family protein n=1 Tax=Streptomyces sp. NPDC020951 TaxID=3365104 RepID=UPI0037B7EF40